MAKKWKQKKKCYTSLEALRWRKENWFLNYCESIRKTFNDEDRFASIILDFIYHS